MPPTTVGPSSSLAATLYKDKSTNVSCFNLRLTTELTLVYLYIQNFPYSLLLLLFLLLFLLSSQSNKRMTFDPDHYTTTNTLRTV